MVLWVSLVGADGWAQGPPSAGFPPAEEPAPPPSLEPAPAPGSPAPTAPPPAQPPPVEQPQPAPPAPASQPAPANPVQQYRPPVQPSPAHAPPGTTSGYPAATQPYAPPAAATAPNTRAEGVPEAPVLPPPPANVCKDRQVSAYETDVDCGGVCGPCEIDESCRAPNDCVSGLCRAGVCHERLYEPGTPIPKGYRLEPAKRDRASTARVAGIGFFAAGYGAAYIAALSSPTSLSWLYVPLVGPWPLLDDAKEFAPEGSVRMTKLILVADGALQIAGALMWIGGSLGRRQQLLREPPPNPGESQTVDALWLSPTVVRGGYALNVGGLF